MHCKDAHWLFEEHGELAPRPSHRLFRQMFERHCPFAVHEPPLGRVPTAQTPLVQTPDAHAVP